MPKIKYHRFETVIYNYLSITLSSVVYTLHRPDSLLPSSSLIQFSNSAHNSSIACFSMEVKGVKVVALYMPCVSGGEGMEEEEKKED
jgi:hypothetical protein